MRLTQSTPHMIPSAKRKRSPLRPLHTQSYSWHLLATDSAHLGCQHSKHAAPAGNSEASSSLGAALQQSKSHPGRCQRERHLVQKCLDIGSCCVGAGGSQTAGYETAYGDDAGFRRDVDEGVCAFSGCLAILLAILWKLDELFEVSSTRTAASSTQCTAQKETTTGSKEATHLADRSAFPE